MSDAAAAASSPDAKPVYRCTNCPAEMYSPYHTICPRCAEPVDYENITRTLGRGIDVAGQGGTAGGNAGVVVGVVVAVLVLIGLVIMLATGN